MSYIQSRTGGGTIRGPMGYGVDLVSALLVDLFFRDPGRSFSLTNFHLRRLTSLRFIEQVPAKRKNLPPLLDPTCPKGNGLKAMFPCREIIGSNSAANVVGCGAS